MISIRTKLLVPVSIISLLMMAITAIFVVSRYHTYDIDAQAATEQRVTRLKNALTDIFVHTQGLLENIGSNRLIIDSLLVNNQYDILENLSPYLEFENLDKLVIYTKEGEVFAQVDEPSRFGHRDDLSQWLLEFDSETKTHCISDLINNQHTLLCGAPINSINGVIGYAVAGYYLNHSFVNWLKKVTFSQISVSNHLVLSENKDSKLTHFNLLEQGLIEQQHHPFYLTLTEDLTDKNKEHKQWIIYSAMIISLNVIVISFLFVYFGVISKAILGLNKYARHVEDRDFSYSYEPKSRANDEIGQIVESFHHIASSYQQFAEICESIADGNSHRNIDISHGQDTLGIAVNTMIASLREKTADNIQALADLNTSNEQLHIAKQKSEKASEEKSIFLATMSHEIRTPLNGIVSMAHQLSKDQLDKSQSEQLDILKACSTHLLAIIDDILDFSKIEAGKMDLNLVHVDIRLLLEDLIAAFIHNARGSRIDLLYLVSTDVPNIIQADPTRLRQVLSNLLANAFKFTSSGEIFIKVSRKQGPDAKLSLLFVVTDTGIGIAEDKTACLFEPFTQADTSMSRQFEGTGLGLAICARLVKLMGGTIWLNNSSNVGAQFHFTIEADHIQQQQISPLLSIHSALIEQKVLIIIDDNFSCGQVLQQRLTELSMQVSTIETAEGALTSRSSAATVDTILLALNRPYNEVWLYISKLRQQHHIYDMPLITFIDHDDSLFMPSDSQLCVHLEKPLLHKQLLEKLHLVLSADMALITKTQPPSSAINLYPSILVVDDNVINQHVILHLLQDTACQVSTSSNGYEALEMISQSHYDIIFIDIHMPDMDGLTLAKKIHQQFSALFSASLIAMTADFSDEIRRQSIAAGMQEIVFKPILLETLEQIITDWQQQNQGKEIADDVSPNKHPLLNSEVLDKYRLVTLENLCDLFSQSGADYIEELDKLYKDQNLSSISQATHRFKGSSLTMGATHLSSLCAQLQHASEQELLQDIPTIIDQIKQCYASTVIELTRYIKMKRHLLDY